MENNKTFLDILQFYYLRFHHPKVYKIFMKFIKKKPALTTRVNSTDSNFTDSETNYQRQTFSKFLYIAFINRQSKISRTIKTNLPNFEFNISNQIRKPDFSLSDHFLFIVIFNKVNNAKRVICLLSKNQAKIKFGFIRMFPLTILLRKEYFRARMVD